MRRGVAWLCVVGVLSVAAAQGRAPAPATTGLDKETSAEVRKLQEKRREILRQALGVALKLYRAARIEPNEVIRISKRLLATEVDLAATQAERIAAHERRLEKAREIVGIAKERLERSRGTHLGVLEARDACLEATIGLLKAGGKPKKVKK